MVFPKGQGFTRYIYIPELHEMIEVIIEFFLELAVYFMSFRVFLILVGAIACGVFAGHVAPDSSPHIVIGLVSGLVAFIIGLVAFPRQRAGR